MYTCGGKGREVPLGAGVGVGSEEAGHNPTACRDWILG